MSGVKLNTIIHLHTELGAGLNRNPGTESSTLQVLQSHRRADDVRTGVRELARARGAVVAGVRGVPGGSADRTHVVPQHRTQHAAVARFQPVARVDLRALPVLLAEATHTSLQVLSEASRRVAAIATGGSRCGIRAPDGLPEPGRRFL